jgi:succinate dehydrogenase flavin-adding protein (antitoxin of CptAB toxin-antitoxin module)
MANTKWTPREIIDKDILELIGGENMSPEEKDEIYKKMMETIQTRVMARVDDLLSDEDAEDVKQFLETDDKEGFEQFMTERNIDIKLLYSEETLFYKLELVQLMSGRGV